MTSGTRIRRTIIEMAQKRQRPGSGSSRDVLLRRTARLKFPDLNPVLAPIPWATVGAAATRLYMPERMTNDLDILINKRDSGEVRMKLTQSGAIHQGDISIGGSSWILSDGFPLDVMEWEEPWVEPALIEAQQNRDGQGLPILPLPFLVLIKFRASRAQDVADISRMLGQATEARLTATRALFAEWLPKDTGDLESLIALGRLELNDEPTPSTAL